MPATDLLELLDAFAAAQIFPWVDGGWAVNALIGRETRPHEDLDIAVEQSDVPAARQILIARGFRDAFRDDTCAWNFVMEDNRGRAVDFHVIVIAANGDGIYGPPANNERYLAAYLTGGGSIGGEPVRCISLEGAVAFRTGWALRPRDCADLRSLQAHFGCPLPPDFLLTCP